MTETRKRCVFVVGFHRSGTSAVMGMLNKLGIPLGDDLYGPREDNPDGFFEDIRIVESHENALKALDMDWHSLAPFPDAWQTSDAARTLRARACEILESELSKKTLFGIKDPRICRFLPIWLDLCQEMSIEPKIVFVLRKPLECAASLKQRDDMPTHHGLLLWLRYTAEANESLKTLDHFILPFGALLQQPDKCLRQLIGSLNLQQTGDNVAANVKEAASFIKPGRRHFSSDKPGKSEPLEELVNRLYRLGVSGSPMFDQLSGEALRRMNQGWPYYGALLKPFVPKKNGQETTQVNSEDGK